MTPKLPSLVVKCYRNLCTVHINTRKNGLFATSRSSVCVDIILGFVLIFFIYQSYKMNPVCWNKI